jgi:hypothetical protein
VAVSGGLDGGDGNISTSILTARLRALVNAGILERKPYQANPPRDEYLLTELGRSLRPVVIALAAWGNSRLEPGQRSMVLVDAETGVEADPVSVDANTGRRVDGDDFVFTAGPAASPRSGPATGTSCGARRPGDADQPRWPA